MIIPHRELSDEALQGLIEDFATRDGTDYGEQEVALTTKVVQIRRQLDEGRAVIVFDEAAEEVMIMAKDRLSGVATDSPD